MFAATNRPWTLFLAVCVVTGTVGCRGSRPFASMVNVTQDRNLELPEIDPPQQRLATAKPRTASVQSTTEPSSIAADRIVSTAEHQADLTTTIDCRKTKSVRR